MPHMLSPRCICGHIHTKACSSCPCPSFKSKTVAKHEQYLREKAKRDRKRRQQQIARTPVTDRGHRSVGPKKGTGTFYER